MNLLYLDVLFHAPLTSRICIWPIYSLSQAESEESDFSQESEVSQASQGTESSQEGTEHLEP